MPQIRSSKSKFSADEDDKYKLQLHLMGAFAEFERSIIKERQREGMRRLSKKAATGRKATIDPDKVSRIHSSGISATAIAKSLVWKGVALFAISRSNKEMICVPLVKLATYTAIAAVLYGGFHYGILAFT